MAFNRIIFIVMDQKGFETILLMSDQVIMYNLVYNMDHICILYTKYVLKYIPYVSFQKNVVKLFGK